MAINCCTENDFFFRSNSFIIITITIFTYQIMFNQKEFKKLESFTLTGINKLTKVLGLFGLKILFRIRVLNLRNYFFKVHLFFTNFFLSLNLLGLYEPSSPIFDLNLQVIIIYGCLNYYFIVEVNTDFCFRFSFYVFYQIFDMNCSYFIFITHFFINLNFDFIQTTIN